MDIIDINENIKMIREMLEKRKKDAQNAILTTMWTIYIYSTGEIIIHPVGMNPRDNAYAKVCIMDGNVDFNIELAKLICKEHNKSLL